MKIDNKTLLTGLKSIDYIHPNDLAFRNSKDKDGALAAKGLSMLSDASVALQRRITEGTYVEIVPSADPYLTGILNNVCAILDYAPVPRLFVRHERDTKITVGGANDAQILMPDYIVNEFDEDMLYYIMGNAVAMMKAGHVKLAAIGYVMIDTPATKLFQLSLKAFMRAADLSSDRGGLLACQSYSAAAKCIMAEAGLPPREMRGLTDEEVAELAEAFMLGAEDVCQSPMSTISGIWKKLNWSTTPAVERMHELSAWYQSGYGDLIARWERS